jgi:hypothetical protein
VTVGGSGSFRALAGELNVDCTVVELDLSLDVPPPALEEIVFVHGVFYVTGATRTREVGWNHPPRN